MSGIFKRTSVRRYIEGKEVTEEQIELILRAAMAAPSACNQQPWDFYVVRDPAVIQKLSESTPFAKPVAEAPLAIVPCTRVSDSYRAADYTDIDMAACTENILLQAAELDLGTVWIGIAPREKRIEKVARIIDAPENLRPFAIIACGHPLEPQKQVDRFDTSRIHFI